MLVHDSTNRSHCANHHMSASNQLENHPVTPIEEPTPAMTHSLRTVKHGVLMSSTTRRDSSDAHNKDLFEQEETIHQEYR